MKEIKYSGFFLPWLFYDYLGSFLPLIILWPFEFSLRHNTVKRFFPILRLVPMEEDFNNLVYGQHLPRWEFCEISSYWKASMADAGIHRFDET